MVKAKKSSPVSRVEVAQASAHLTKLIIAAATEQGSVGKSTFLLNLVQFYKDHRLKPRVAAFDPDFRKPSLKACHPETELIDITQGRQLDTLVTALSAADITVVDGMAGHFGHSFERWARDVRLHSRNGRAGIAERVGAAITYFVVIDDSLENIEALRPVLENTPSEVRLLVVRNYHKIPGGICSGQTLTRWERSEIRRGFLDRGAVEIDMDRLDKDCMEYVEKFHHTPGWLAQENNPKGLNLCDHQRFITFAEDLYAQFEQASAVLFPPALLASPAR